MASFTLNTVQPPLPPLGQTTPLRRRQPPNTTAPFQQTAAFQLSQRTKHHCARQHSSSCAVLWLHWLHEHHIIHRHNNCTSIKDFTLVWAHYNTQIRQLHVHNTQTHIGCMDSWTPHYTQTHNNNGGPIHLIWVAFQSPFFSIFLTLTSNRCKWREMQSVYFVTIKYFSIISFSFV